MAIVGFSGEPEAFLERLLLSCGAISTSRRHPAFRTGAIVAAVLALPWGIVLLKNAPGGR
jgi:hypothetical protein